MMSLCFDILSALKGKTLVTAESCTGGGIGAALTAVSGASEVYRGGVICYQNDIKEKILGVDAETLVQVGPVSESVARQMASGVRKLMHADIAVSVTGLAGPSGDDYGNPVGCVFIGYEDADRSVVREYLFDGDRDQVREKATFMTLQMILEFCN